MSDRPDVIVVGGGAIGCGVAYFLAKSGRRVRIVEKNTIGSGCSHGNCGYVCPSHALPLTAPGAIGKVMLGAFNPDSPLYIRPRFDPALMGWLTQFALRCRRGPMLEAMAARRALLDSSKRLYLELIGAESLDVEWEDRGLLMVYKSQEEFDAFAKTAELARREFEYVFDPYEGAKLNELEPTLKPELAGGWLATGDAHLRPDRLMAEMKRVLGAMGVEFFEQTEVNGFEFVADQATGVATSQGVMQADTFVVTAGAESPRFARGFGCALPIQPGKGYSITMPHQAGGPKLPVILEESHVAITPWASGLRIGSTMEFVGYDRSINPRRIELFKRAAAEHLIDAPTGPVEEEWAGWRPMTHDEIPRLGRSPKRRNVFVAAGHGMIGISTMPGSGKLLSELVTGAEPHIDPTPYALGR